MSEPALSTPSSDRHLRIVSNCSWLRAALSGAPGEAIVLAVGLTIGSKV